MRTRVALLLWLAVLCLSAACGDDDETSQEGPSIGVGPGISVAEALASDLEGPFLVNGFVVVRDGEVRLCSVIAASLPPLCGGESLKVEGLDLSTVAGLKTEQGVSWTDEHVQILGNVDDDVLLVSLTSR